MQYIIIFVTASGKKEAEKIAKTLLAKKLIACANISEKIESHYTWRGKSVSSLESLIIMKTKKRLFKEAAQVIKKCHSYDVPEIIAVNLSDADKEYLKWIDEVTK